jgi:hypothetical protein
MKKFLQAIVQYACHEQRSETGKHMQALDLLSLCIYTGADGFRRM